MSSLVTYIPALTRLGLTEYEAKIYAALVKSGSKTAGELSFLSGVPRTKLYGSVRELMQKGLVRTTRRKPETFSAIAPNEALFPLAEKMLKEAEESLEKVQSLALAYESMRLLTSRRPLKTDLSSVEGRRTVSENTKQLLLSSTKSVAMTASANSMVRLYRIHSKVIEQAVARGVQVRLIAEVTPHNSSVAKEMSVMLKLKQSPKISLQTIIVDSSTIALFESIPDDLEDDIGNDVGVISENPQIVEAFKSLYDLVWATLL